MASRKMIEIYRARKWTDVTQDWIQKTEKREPFNANEI